MVKELIPDATYFNAEGFLANEVQKEEFLKFIQECIGKPHRTFPMVFFKGVFVGGFIETHKLCTKFEAEND
jgi:hypothetical protein